MTEISDIASKPQVYSWSTKVDFMLNSVGGFKDMEQEQLSVPWHQPLLLTLQKNKIHPNLEGSGASGYQLVLDAAKTADEAEELGKRLTLALLKVSVDKNWGMRLSWQDTPLPCQVVDRSASAGATIQMFGSVTGHVTVAEFGSLLEATFMQVRQAPYRLLLSMELFASARFESDNRARLILLVSALEALSEQQDLSDTLGPVIDTLLEVVRESVLEETQRNSLIGRVRELKRQSVRQAIRRTLENAAIERVEMERIEVAYSARSKILHEGRRVPELGVLIGDIERIITRVFDSHLGHARGGSK